MHIRTLLGEDKLFLEHDFYGYSNVIPVYPSTQNCKLSIGLETYLLSKGEAAVMVEVSV